MDVKRIYTIAWGTISFDARTRIVDAIVKYHKLDNYSPVLDRQINEWFDANFNGAFMYYNKEKGLRFIDFHDQEKYVEFCLKWM